MTRLNSFYLSPEEWPANVGDIVRLDGGEARHMLTVLRTQPDQIIRLFDGQGRDGMFQVTHAKKNNALLKAIRLELYPSPSAGITLAIGWGKSKRRNYLFEKTVEMNGYGLVFWQAKRSQGHVPKTIKETWTDKCIQAAKQCGSVHLPELTTLPGGIDALIDYSHTFDRQYVAWESTQATKSLTPDMIASGRSLVIIGPEGGFDSSEAERLIQADCKPVTLGTSILRWETAATYCLSLSYFAGQIT